MKYRKIISFILTSICALDMYGQRITFDRETITSNTMWKHPTTAVFRFKNKGNDPLIITDVDAGCGCMSPKWTQGPIEKGESGEIVITYDAKQLGSYDKIIEVMTNISNEPIDIRMIGKVTSGTRQTLEDVYPYAIDDIYLSTSNVEFSEVSKRGTAKANITIYNNGQSVYTPSLMHLPQYITANYEPEMIARGKKGNIELTLHGDKLNDYGLNQTNIYLARFAGDKVGNNNEINVSAILLPDLTTEANSINKPRFEISTTELYLGKIGKKKNLSGTVKLRNTGNKTLRIDRVQAFNQAIMVNLPKTEIAPGESIKMNIKVQAKYLGMSKAQPRVLIITNDANHPKEVVTVVFE